MYVLLLPQNANGGVFVLPASSGRDPGPLLWTLAETSPKLEYFRLLEAGVMVISDEDEEPNVRLNHVVTGIVPELAGALGWHGNALLAACDERGTYIDFEPNRLAELIGYALYGAVES